MNDLTTKLSDFFKESLNFIDDQDLDREFSKTQLKYGKEMLVKDLDLKTINNNIESIKTKTKELNNSNSHIKKELNKLKSEIR